MKLQDEKLLVQLYNVNPYEKDVPQGDLIFGTIFVFLFLMLTPVLLQRVFG